MPQTIRTVASWFQLWFASVSRLLTLSPSSPEMDANGIQYMCILNAHYASIACIPMSWFAMYVAESATMWCRPTFRLSCFHVVCDHGKHVNDVKAKVFEAEPAVAIKQDEKYQTRGCRVSWLLQIVKAKSLLWYMLEFFEIKECFLGTCDFCVYLANGPKLNHDGFKWFDTHLQLARLESRTFTYSALSNDLATISLHLRSRLDLDHAIRHDQDAMFLASGFDDGKLAQALYLLYLSRIVFLVFLHKMISHADWSFACCSRISAKAKRQIVASRCVHKKGMY